MRPFTPDDLLPLADYAARRAEFFEAHRRYCEQYRRVCIGPYAKLLFENRQTLWFRAQELLAVLRIEQRGWVMRELALCNRLLPRRSHLRAAVILDGEANWSAFDADSIRLMLDTAFVPARLESCRPEDAELGASYWLELTLSGPDRTLLGDFSVPAWIEVNCGNYRHSSGPLTDDVRQSLLDDLAMSDRDAA